MNYTLINKSKLCVSKIALAIILFSACPTSLIAENSSALFSRKSTKEKYLCKNSKSLKELEEYTKLNDMELAHILEAKTNQVDKLRNLLGKKLSAKDKTGLSLLARLKKEKPALRKLNLEALFQDQNNLLTLNKMLSSDF